jgi:UDPglucose 6-dehydrogenase
MKMSVIGCGYLGAVPAALIAFIAAPASSAPTRRSPFLREVDNINMRRRIRMVELAREV